VFVVKLTLLAGFWFLNRLAEETRLLPSRLRAPAVADFYAPAKGG